MKQKRQEIIDLIFGGLNFLSQVEIDEVVRTISDYPDIVYLTFQDLADQFKWFGPDMALSRMEKRKELVLNYNTLVKNAETRLPEYFI
jgi:hypothetical protein